jgi:hypothetical protein
MLRSQKLLMAAMTAVLLLALAGAVASANRLAFNETRKRVIFPTLEFSANGITIRCSTTLEGSFHSRTISKVSGSLIGYITSALLSPCNGGNGIVNRETLPWHLRYTGFQGTLPRITGISLSIIRPSFTFEVFGILCRYTPSTLPARNELEVGGVVVSVAASASNIGSETIGCPSTNTLSGNGNAQTGSGGALQITLVQ